MSQLQDSRYCPHCEKKTLAIARGANHTLHLLLTIFTCTFWGWIWLILVLVGSSYRCTKCGTTV